MGTIVQINAIQELSLILSLKDVLLVLQDVYHVKIVFPVVVVICILILILFPNSVKNIVETAFVIFTNVMMEILIMEMDVLQIVEYSQVIFVLEDHQILLIIA